MALNKVNIPVASGRMNEFDLSCDHQTSMNFMLAQPIYYRHLPRGEHFTDETLGVVRPVSMAVPTFGRIRNNIRAFFVPYRLVFPQYDAARADVLGYNYSNSAIPLVTPQVDIVTIQNYFLNTTIVGVGPLTTDLGTTDPSPSPYDFVFSGHYYVYTAAGRRRLKLLRCLGYEPIWGGASKGFYYDILGLLSYAQIYLDWYANAQYLDSTDVVELRKILSYNDPSTGLVINQAQFTRLLALVFNVVYDSDEYFNAAWDNPVSPTTGQWSLPAVTDIDGANNTGIVSSTNGTPIMNQNSTSVLSLGSQYLHDMLQALSNYQRRHALSGAREIDRALADYGFVSDYQSLKRAVYIGNRSFDVQIGDVYSHADTSAPGNPSNLGDFAGRGFGNGQGKFDFTASEDGVIIIVSTIVPSCDIVQGYDRNNRHLSKFDMYDPNFEVGVQVLEKGEVYISDKDTFATSVPDYATNFGWTGRFGEYKRPRSWWTSENRCPSADIGGSSWNLFRLFDDANFSNSISNLTHSLNFTRSIDWENFNRIFNYVSSDRDKFDCFYHHEVHCQSPMKPLFETYDFKEAHKQIKMDINGSKLN